MDPDPTARQRDLARRRSQERRRRVIARRRAVALLTLAVLVLVVVWAAWPSGGSPSGRKSTGASGRHTLKAPTYVTVTSQGDGIKMATFLGTETRRFYGVGPAPHHLKVIWSTLIGGGWTSGKYAKSKPDYWAGTGWTGMPALVRDGGVLYLLIGGYDHCLHKIDTRTGKIVWKYRFDDIVKSSPSVFVNPHPTGSDDKYVVVAGSRRGYPFKLGDPRVASYRAVAFGSGRELWRLPVPRTVCYSRDVDGSGFFMDGRQYIGVESGLFYSLDPLQTQPWRTFRSPKVLASDYLPGPSKDPKRLAYIDIEASPALMNGTIYIDSGNGEVYGLRPDDLKVVFDYHVGSDINGTTVPTVSGKLLVPIEKQSIPGPGGMLMLDPSKPAARSVVWYFPTGTRHLGEWEGGIIGSPAVNDQSNRDGRRPALAAFLAIDGYLYVVSQDTLATSTVSGPALQPGLRTPVLLAKRYMIGGISSPIIVGDTLIVGAYDQKVHMFRLVYRPAAKGAAGAAPSRDGRWWTVRLAEIDSFTASGTFESTPVLWDGCVYIGSRNGYFYCLGDK